MAARFCSLYREIHYIEVCYIEVWVYTHNTLESLHIYYMGNKSNYLIIIHHLRSFENYAFVVDTHNDVHISSFHFVHREELAMKIGLTEARIQVSFFSILLWAPYHTMYIQECIIHWHLGPAPKYIMFYYRTFIIKRMKMLAPIFDLFLKWQKFGTSLFPNDPLLCNVYLVLHKMNKSFLRTIKICM